MAGFPKVGVPLVAAFNKTAQPGVTCPSPLTTAAMTCDGGGVVSDEITVNYQGTTDCLGQAVAGGVVIDTFYIDTRRLMCRGNGNAQGQPLVEGVENMQVLYGEDFDAVDTPGRGYADRYVRADDVVNWNNVVAVRVAVLASSIDTVIGDDRTVTPTFQLLDVGGIGPLPAGVRGRVFTTTIEIRNRTQ